ncbi:hypothetical protein [Bradyrhizobium sp. CB3481]|uniref:hypothetical protein n=1 Tax=Bradyrhizobium sp. CB3481 TaxID=3039158 RepID=UPI0024B1D9CB|nr:hypothetical protein [Bradyrhizobium sp. CB3481]WFU15031.1 hypothetical protein QA643_29205 [Bradyrhizobium sp. CB3481]
MSISRPKQPVTAGDSSPGTRYTHRASLVGSAHAFELTDQGLSWEARGRSGMWPYSDIAAIRLSYRPVSMQSRRFRADVQHRSGQSLAIFSTSWQTIALMVPQDGDFRAFIEQLHERLKAAGGNVALVGGIGPIAYAGGCLLLALVAIAVVALLARAVATGQFAAALFLLGFTALAGWQMGGFIWRNKPRRYSFDDLPQTLLPPRPRNQTK